MKYNKLDALLDVHDLKCEHPVIIVNPLAPELIAKYRNYTIRGKVKHIYQSRKPLLYAFKTLQIQPRVLKIEHNDIPYCYITDYDTGKRYPLYLETPCGHCVLCKEAKVNSFVERCKLETQLYNCKPIFLTLTYDELHKKECGVCLRDVQLFYKRLRINLFRKGYRKKIRMVTVAEYGRRTKRPHYHAIIWNLSADSVVSFGEIRNVIEKSWSNGFVMLRLVDPSNDKAFYYTSKYLRKDCNIPSGCANTFLVSSNRNGGIGAPFLLRHREHVKRTLNTQLKYVNKWNGRTYDVQLNRYALNKLLPSFSRSLPYSIKKRVRRFVLNYRYLYQSNNTNCLAFSDTYKQVMKVFSKYIYFPALDYVPHSLIDVHPDIICRQMIEDEERILRVLKMDIDDAYRVHQLREPYLIKLFSVPREFDVGACVYKVKRRKQLSAEREVF